MSKVQSILVALALVWGIVLPIAANVEAQVEVQCPAPPQVGVITGLPDPWWSTPNIGPLDNLNIDVIGGKKVLVCEYRVFSTRVKVMREFPPGMNTCTVKGSKFVCSAREIPSGTGRTILPPAMRTHLPPAKGTCSISGKAFGSEAGRAPAFEVSLRGPDRQDLSREKRLFDSSGRYSFHDLPNGKYWLSVKAIGDLPIRAVPQQKSVDCTGGPVEVDFELK